MLSSFRFEISGAKSFFRLCRLDFSEKNATQMSSQHELGTVTVEELAQNFGISSRQIQRFVALRGMPRDHRGHYDLFECSKWYASYLHGKVCGCIGPCRGFDPATRAETNAIAERKRVMVELAEDLPRKLAGKKPAAIREILLAAIDEVYGDSVSEEDGDG
jgi:hypothetical protein